MNQESETEMLKEYAEQEYKYGFVTDIESEKAPIGLNEDMYGIALFDSLPDQFYVISIYTIFFIITNHSFIQQLC